MTRMRISLAAGVVVAAALGFSLRAAEAPPAPPATQPATRPSDADVMRDLLKDRQDAPLVEPSRRSVTNPATTQPLDPALMGTAPNGVTPKLRREGEFVVSRRGRVVRGPNSGQLIFVFDADSQTAPEPPMFLVPCQLLQNMEEMIQERGDRVVFIVSGQVLTYRAANYLLPTIMKVTIDKGNLQK